MSWGIEIYDDEGKPIKVTGTSFVLDQFTVTSSGSRTYTNVPPGKKLSAAAINVDFRNLWAILETNGNTIKWTVGKVANCIILVMAT